jgi:quinol monooxygenase YgiN
MDHFALLAVLDAKPEKEKEVEDFLKAAQPLALQETGTTTWYALKIGPSTYGIFDTFPNDEARNAHLTGEIAKALFARAEELFLTPPKIEMLEILAAKAPNV